MANHNWLTMLVRLIPAAVSAEAAFFSMPRTGVLRCRWKYTDSNIPPGVDRAVWQAVHEGVPPGVQEPGHCQVWL